MGWDAPAPLVWSASDHVALAGRGAPLVPWIAVRAEGGHRLDEVERDDLVAQGVPAGRIAVVPAACLADAWPSWGSRSARASGYAGSAACSTTTLAGVESMVRALVTLPDMRLLVVGRAGAEGTVAAARRVALLARNLHVDGRVSVLAEASAAVAGACRCAGPTSSPTSLPDAPTSLRVGAALVSGGIPMVLAGNGAEEIVEHGVSGVCLRSLDVRQLTSTLRILDRDPDVRNTMAVAARRRARETYDHDTLAAACVDAYRRARWHRIPVVLGAGEDGMLDRGSFVRGSRGSAHACLTRESFPASSTSPSTHRPARRHRPGGGATCCPS